MYCGDETGSFIGHIGSHVSRFGYGGDDTPKYIVPSYMGCEAATENPTETAATKTASSASSSTTTSRRKDKLSVRMSCYNSRWAEQECYSAMRLASGPASLNSNNNTASNNSNANKNNNPQLPIVDPAYYLAQGDQVADWDVYEQLWRAAFATLRVRDKLKHTVGGGDATLTTGEDDDRGADARVTAAGGATSTTLRPGIPNHQIMHPLLAVSPGVTHMVQRDGAAATTTSDTTTTTASKHHVRQELLHITELLMETFDCPAMFVAPAPMLAAFSHGRQTCLVVDVGAGGARCTPVVDGMVLKQAQRRSGRGGDWLSNVQWRALLEDRRLLLRPRYQTSASQMVAGRGIFHQWAMQDLMTELRCCEHVAFSDLDSTPTVPPFCSKATSSTESKQEEAPSSPMETDDDDDNKAEAACMFELPDGTLLDLSTGTGKEMRRVPDLLFSDELPFWNDSNNTTSHSILNQHASLSNLPLHKLVQSSLAAVGDIDVRKDLAASILLTGGCSLLKGLEQQLSHKVANDVTYKTKVLASKYNVERSHASWIGGSILTSLGSFQQLWLGRTEYDEYGATMALQRFP